MISGEKASWIQVKESLNVKARSVWNASREMLCFFTQLLFTDNAHAQNVSFPTADSLAAPACHWKVAQACHQTRKNQCPISCWPATKDSCWQSSVTSRQSPKPSRLFLDSTIVTIPSTWDRISRLNEIYEMHKRHEPTDSSSWLIKSFSLLPPYTGVPS